MTRAMGRKRVVPEESDGEKGDEEESDIAVAEVREDVQVAAHLTGAIAELTRETRPEDMLFQRDDLETDALSSEDADDELVKLSGEERARLLQEEIDRQWAEAQKTLAPYPESSIGPVTSFARQREEKERSLIKEEAPSWKAVVIRIPVPVGYLTVAERINGRLAIFGIVVCLLRQILEPGHPLFTEQLLQTGQLILLLPIILQSSLSNVQMDDLPPPPS